MPGSRRCRRIARAVGSGDREPRAGRRAPAIRPRARPRRERSSRARTARISARPQARRPGQVRSLEPRPISTSRQPVFASQREKDPIVEEFRPFRAFNGIIGLMTSPATSERRRPPGEAEQQNRPSRMFRRFEGDRRSPLVSWARFGEIGLARRTVLFRPQRRRSAQFRATLTRDLPRRSYGQCS